MIDVNGTLYLTVYDNVNGWNLWRSDGTAFGTTVVFAFPMSNLDPYESSLLSVDGQLFFLADDGAGGLLYRSNGTPHGTELVLPPATQPSNASQYTEVGAWTYFVADDGLHGTELWRTDGSAAGTSLVKDIHIGVDGSLPSQLTNVNGTLFFSADDGVNGTELWTSDGTAEGTVQVKNIASGNGSASPTELLNVNGLLFFAADDGTNGRELWTSDGTEVGTTQVKDIQLGVNHSAVPSLLTNVNGVVYFWADDGASAHGRELWKSDGTEAGTMLVKDINPGTAWSFPQYLVNVSGVLYFSADDGVNGRELWKSDGTESGTVQVMDIQGGFGSSVPSLLTNVAGVVYFWADDGASANGRELWKSDGTTSGTVLVKDINPGSAWSHPQYLVNVNGTLYFSADDGTHGRELWKSDGTEAGTVLILDVDGSSGSSDPSYLTNVGGRFYFSAENGQSGRELWVSDGTMAGTMLVEEIRSRAGSSDPTSLTAVGEMLYFTADNGNFGAEPFTAGLEIEWSFEADLNNPGKFVVSATEAFVGYQTLEVRTNAAGELEYSVNGGGFTNDLDSNTAGLQTLLLADISRLDIDLGLLDDTLIVNNSGLGGSSIPALEGLRFSDSGSGNDLLIVQATNEADSIEIDSTSGIVQVAGREILVDDTVEAVHVDAGGGADSIIVTQPAGGSFPTTVNIHAGSGDDTVNVNLDLTSSDGIITVDLGAGAGDRLNVRTMSAEADLVTVLGTMVTAQRGPNASSAPSMTVKYSHVEILFAYAGDGDDTVSVKQPGMGSFPDIVAVETEAGNDLVEIELGLAGSSSVMGVIMGAGTNDRLSVFTRSNNADVVIATGNAVRAQLGPNPNAAPPKTINYTGVEALSLLAGEGNDSVSTRQGDLTTFPALVSIFAQGGNDLIEVEMGSTLSTQATVFGIDAGAGDGDRFTFFTRSGHADSLIVTGSSVQAQIGPNALSNPYQTANYSGVEQLSVVTGGGNDTISVREGATPTFPAVMAIEPQDENDLVEIEHAHETLATAFGVNAGAGNEDRLSIFTRSGHGDYMLANASYAASRSGPNQESNPFKVVNYTGVDILSLLSSGGNDTLQVDMPQAGTMPIVALEGMDEDDSFVINLGGNPAAASAFGVNGGGGSLNSLAVNTVSGHADNVLVSGSFVASQLGPNATSNPFKMINYSNLGALTVLTGGGDDVITATMPPTGFFPGIVNLRGQDENDSFIVNVQGAGTLGLFSIDGGAGANNRVSINSFGGMNDFINVGGTITEVQIGPNAPANPKKTITYLQINELTVFGAGGADTITADAPESGSSPTVVNLLGGDDSDSFELALGGVFSTVLWTLDGQGGVDNVASIFDKPSFNSEIVIAPVAAPNVIGVTNANFLQVFGQDGNDRIEIQVAIETFVNGGAGNDTILGSSLDDVLYGDSDDDHIDGRGGNDVLIGSLGRDTLLGGVGRDVLFGGAGDDSLNGGAGDDILIGPATTHETTFASVIAIINEWASNRTLQQRISNLSNTSPSTDRLNGNIFLIPGTTVADDENEAVDSLFGDSGQDWFIYEFGKDIAQDRTIGLDVGQDL